MNSSVESALLGSTDQGRRPVSSGAWRTGIRRHLAPSTTTKRDYLKGSKSSQSFLEKYFRGNRNRLSEEQRQVFCFWEDIQKKEDHPHNRLPQTSPVCLKIHIVPGMFQIKGHDLPSKLQSVWCGLQAIMWCPTVSLWLGDTEMPEQSRQTRKCTPTALRPGQKYGDCLIQNSLRALSNWKWEQQERGRQTCFPQP